MEIELSPTTLATISESHHFDWLEDKEYQLRDPLYHEILWQSFYDPQLPARLYTKIPEKDIRNS